MIVKDDHYDEKGIWIENSEGEFVMCLESEGTTMYFDTWTPSLDDLDTLRDIILSSPHIWDPNKI